jgi:hypothetical protein
MSPDDPGYKGARYADMPSLWDGFANLVRPGLGITAFGANVMNLPPDYETKAHDEDESGQEELYVGLEGSGWVVMGDGERCALDNGSAVRVSPGVSRVGDGRGQGGAARDAQRAAGHDRGLHAR